MLHDTPPGLQTALDRAAAREAAVAARLRAVWAATPLPAAGESDAAAGGKRSRARLALNTAAVLGCAERDGDGAATAVELLHAASLVHDDLIDGDTLRRGGPSIWARYGTADAVLLGDRLIAAAHAEAAATGAPRAAVSYLSTTVQRLIDGVARERAPTAAPPGPAARDAYLAAARAKAGALFACAVELPMLVADAPAAERDAARAALEALGAAYQLHDDLADLDGDKDGRPPAGDVLAGRLCAPVAALRAQGDRDLAAALDHDLSGRGDPAAWLARLRARDVRDTVDAWHAGLLAEARDAAGNLRPGLAALVHWAQARVAGSAGAEKDSSWTATAP